ncbi:MAG: hypothetical protein RLZZ618_2781 [Pseudomonadota bacterium]|jgi:hypothetical protein
MLSHGIRLLVVLLLVAAGFWVASVTEWTEVDVRTPAKGEAAKNNLYVIGLVAKQLGAEVTTATDLSNMPPPGATLLLTSWHWDMFPERAEKLRQWVAQGGHLVMHTSAALDDPLRSWMPVSRDDEDEDNADVEQPAAIEPADGGDDDADNEAPAENAQAPAAADNSHAGSACGKGSGRPDADRAAPQRSCDSKAPARANCHTVTEWASLPPAFPDGDRSFQLCGLRTEQSTLSAKPPAKVLWALNGVQGPILLRASFEKGSVTLSGPWGLLHNESILKDDDHVLVAVAALQIRRGSQLWLVAEEARPSLLLWLWQRAWVVVLLGLTALVFALWRGGIRFGALAGIPPHGRRSMAEQITGTARFLRRSGAPALVAAQWRALDEAGAARLRNYREMDRHERLNALAGATGIDARDLGAALDPAKPLPPADLASALELFETARRLLLQSPRNPKA